MYKLVPKLWYMFSEDILIFDFPPKNNIFRFSVKSQKIHRTPVMVTLTVTVKIFWLGNVTKI